MTTTSQKRAKLKSLSNAVKSSLFDMLKLTDEILSDAEYVDSNGGEGDLIDAMEVKEFSHFGGQPSLMSMLRAYRKNPVRSAWKEYSDNVRVMIDLADPERDRGDVVRINWKAKCAELEERIEQLDNQLTEYMTTVDDLRVSRDEMLSQNGELRGQVKLLRHEPLGV